jgi:hypothetical protein
MHFLIISDITDIKEKKITHYSLDKGLNLGIGLKNNNCTIDYIVSTNSYQEDGINYICYKDLNADKIDLYDFVIVVREGLIEELFNIFEELKKVFFNTYRKTKFVVKSDSCTWIISKDFRKYIARELQINGSTGSIIKWVNDNIDVICVQNNEYFEQGLSYGIKQNKMLISNMAVPYELIDFEQLENPFKSDYSYCKMDKKMLGSGEAFLPNYYITNPDKLTELTSKKRIRIIYMGRIKTDSGKIIFMMRDIMEQLGDDYELHIFPGSFVIYDELTDTTSSYSANNSNHLEILKNTIFSNSNNVFVHVPFNHKDIKKYLWNVDIGIDFSSSRPENKKANAGNAKLLEYCYMGLPVVTEKNVNNSWLVTNCSNGIVLDGIATVQDYVDSIHKLTNELEIDRKKASNITIQNENWNLRAKNFINDLLDKI